MSPIERLIWDGTQWVGDSFVPAITNRDYLIPLVGTYDPGPETTGPIAKTSFTQLEPNPGVDYIEFKDPNITLDGYEIWGEIRNQHPTTKFKNCILRGRNPDTQTASTNMSGVIKAYDTHKHLVLEDSKIDPIAWVTERGSTALSPQSAGIHGADVELIRSEIVNVQDGWNVVGIPGSFDAQYTSAIASWIHKGYFENNWTGPGHPSDLRTHCDGIQLNYVAHMLVDGCVIGGDRVQVGYNTWPGGYNAGDDFWNSAIFIRMQSSNSANFFRDITFKRNLLAGGTATINQVYDTTRGDTMADLHIIDNRFLQRQSGWNTGATGPGQLGTGDGRYALRSVSIASEWARNVINGTTTPITITQQANAA